MQRCIPREQKLHPLGINLFVQANEKYIGDALLQKTVTTDFLNKKRVANKGIVPQYYVENSHEAIIPRALFLQVQEEMVRRARVKCGCVWALILVWIKRWKLNAVLNALSKQRRKQATADRIPSESMMTHSIRKPDKATALGTE